MQVKYTHKSQNMSTMSGRQFYCLSMPRCLLHESIHVGKTSLQLLVCMLYMEEGDDMNH